MKHCATEPATGTLVSVACRSRVSKRPDIVSFSSSPFRPWPPLFEFPPGLIAEDSELRCCT